MAERAYQGFYINLDRSPERRRTLEAHIAELGLKDHYARFAAVDGKTVDLSPHALKPGEVGVFLSHYKALEQAKGAGKCVHIVEDDVILSKHVRPVIEGAVANNLFDHYDVVFTDSVVNCHLGLLKNLTNFFDQVQIPPDGVLRYTDLKLMDLTQVFFAAFQSYVVGPKSIDRLLALYRHEIAAGLKTPVDIFIQQQVLARKLRATCAFPFLTSFRIDEITTSTIGDQAERAGGPSIMILAVLRYLFFIDRDLDHAKRVLDGATTQNRQDTNLHHQLLAQATEFMLSKDFEG